MYSHTHNMHYVRSTVNTDNIYRETIAKLMANENITVTHSPLAKTASFDVKNRELILPVWKDNNPSVYTLLISHEVGHALYTPQDELIEVLQSKPELKSIINVFEDARIEKLIQNKYPGIRYSFIKGYKELFNNNFFGTEDRDADSYHLIDRINIHFKVGEFGYHEVPFTSDEYQWVTRIENCNTFSEVVNLAKEFFELNTQDEQQTTIESVSDSSTDDSKAETNASENISSTKTEEQPKAEEELNGTNNSSNSNKESDKTSSDASSNIKNDSDVVSETQENFEQSVTNALVDGCKELNRFKIPKIDSSEYIIPYKSIHDNINKYYESLGSDSYYSVNVMRSKYAQFKQKHGFSINSMANLFEMKKKARLYSRSSTSKSGQLNMNTVHSYRYNEDIFKKITVTPEGKSHGLVMFFDMSSSMEQTISSCIEQILILSMFCKKINIPFDVYGFSDNSYSRNIRIYDHSYDSCFYTSNKDDFKIDKNFKLRHYLSSSMSNVEYESAFINMLRLSSGYEYATIPHDEYLNSTPLAPCILMSKNVITKFKKKYSLDIVNAIYLTDGEDTHGVISEVQGSYSRIERDYKRKITLKSEITNKEYLIKNSEDNDYIRSSNIVVKNLLNIVKDETGANVISFYLLHTPIERKAWILDEKCSTDKFSKFYKQNGFYEFKNHFGYDSYYIIRSNNLSLNDTMNFDEMDADLDETNEKEVKKNIKKIAKTFDKYMSTCSKNKIFLNRFIEQIS